MKQIHTLTRALAKCCTRAKRFAASSSSAPSAHAPCPNRQSLRHAVHLQVHIYRLISPHYFHTRHMHGLYIPCRDPVILCRIRLSKTTAHFHSTFAVSLRLLPKQSDGLNAVLAETTTGWYLFGSQRHFRSDKPFGIRKKGAEEEPPVGQLGP